MPEGTSFSVLQVVTVPPKDEYTAEVVVLVTSLGARRKAFNSSRRAVDLLDIKGVPYRIVDLASRECLEGESKAIAQASRDTWFPDHTLSYSIYLVELEVEIKVEGEVD